MRRSDRESEQRTVLTVREIEQQNIIYFIRVQLFLQVKSSKQKINAHIDIFTITNKGSRNW